MTEITISIAASTGTMENIGFSSGTATVATSDVPIVLNGSDSTSNPYGFNIERLERFFLTLDGQAQERHRMPMPRIGSVPDPRGNFPFSKRAGAD